MLFALTFSLARALVIGMLVFTSNPLLYLTHFDQLSRSSQIISKRGYIQQSSPPYN
nr:MAG TPA: hypothetical protein [Caudoviricetes sp.]